MSDISVTGVYETVLYAEDVSAVAAFYAGALGLRIVDGPDELAAALRLPSGGVLLVFDPQRAGRPGRPVPSHGTTGPGHIAFAVPAGSLDAWRERLVTGGQELEREVEWDGGGRSLYLRDPAGNSVELAEGELWPP